MTFEEWARNLNYIPESTTWEELRAAYQAGAEDSPQSLSERPTCICDPPDYPGAGDGGWDRDCPIHGEPEAGAKDSPPPADVEQALMEIGQIAREGVEKGVGFLFRADKVREVLQRVVGDARPQSAPDWEMEAAREICERFGHTFSETKEVLETLNLAVPVANIIRKHADSGPADSRERTKEKK